MDYLNLNTDEMSMLMSTCGLSGRKVHNNWKGVFTPSRIISDYELDTTSIKGVRRQWVIKFGQSKDGSVDNMNRQIQLASPRIASHSFITQRRELKNHLRSLMGSATSNNNEESSNKFSDESSSDKTANETANNNDGDDEPDPTYVPEIEVSKMSMDHIQALQYKLY